MSSLKMRDPDILEKRSGGGCLMLFGLPFFCAGLFVLLGVLGVIPVEMDGPWFVFLLFGLVFAAVGAALMFGRSGLTINRRRRLITKWYGLLSPMKRSQYSLDDYGRVTLSKEVRKSGKSSVTVYPVRLCGESDTKAIEIEAPQDYHSSRESAEKVAKFLNLMVSDSSSGESVIREAGELDESLRQRARRTGERIELPSPPPNLRTQISVVGGTLTLNIPPPGFNLGSYIQMAMGVVIPCIVIFWFILPFFKMDMPEPIRYVFLGFLSVFFVILPIATIWGKAYSRARMRVRVIASRKTLRVEQVGLTKTRMTEIPADELEELTLPERTPSAEGNPIPEYLSFLSRLVPNPVITARSDRATIKFGVGLPQEELQYIYTVIRKLMTE